MKVLLRILLFVFLISTGSSEVAFPIATIKSENDVVPQLWKGWLLLDYNFLFYDNGPFRPTTDISYHSREMMTEQEFDLCGTLGLGNSISTQILFPYRRIENSGNYNLIYGSGDVDIAGKWNFVDENASQRAGVMVGCTIPTGYSELSSGRYLPWMKLIAGLPFGTSRLIGNIGYRYYPLNSTGYFVGSQIPFAVAFQYTGQEIVVIPIELFGHYQFHSLYHTAHTSVRLNLTLNCFIIKEHLSLGGGVLLPFQAYLGSAGGLHLNAGFYY
jgi:hypothetical protein